ncbi:type I-E CRISPR-associated protein Cas6/Cse3/CasE [Streptomyces cyaneofuscatus]|uniref:type I-E CRISPR-associated protein Cas6/Cse3/CasE n=1 Tax=Streptomyces cyaneofuscatus TaxID=66883 RepID=UPI003863097C|nr:type I-E CRISPR-associated protein Cas6/Cse3/CasE [Streptomyces cyaneofuscatus]
MARLGQLLHAVVLLGDQRCGFGGALRPSDRFTGDFRGFCGFWDRPGQHGHHLDQAHCFGRVLRSRELAVRMLPRISSPAPHKGLRLVRAEVRGKLTVTDPKTFVGALTRGLGHGKAYSCGLLLVR